MFRSVCVLLSIAFFVACSEEQSLVEYVNTMVGTAPNETSAAGLFGKGSEEHGQTLPAVLVPNGMNFWTPQTSDTELKCRAPYYYQDSLFQGFRNSHWIVGGCTQDYGSMTIMPVSGALRVQPESRASRFSHESEISRPDFYSVSLLDYGIRASMTASSRCALFKFHYQTTDSNYVVINPNSDEGQGYIEIIPEKRMIRGYNPVHRIYQGKGQPAGFSGYFSVYFQDDFEEYGTFVSDSVKSGYSIEHDKHRIGAWVKLPSHKKFFLVKVSTSFTGWQGCEMNLNELPGWDFTATQQCLKSVWQHHLGKISLPNATDSAKTMFYSALYRSSFLPHVFNDIDGSYPSFATGDSIMMVRSLHNYYEDFSMWDTYRALHPLLTILSPSMSADMMQSLVLKYQQGGWLPIFPCWNSYTAAMVGDHCIAAIGDAYLKGITDFDINTAYEAMRKNAFQQAPESDYNNGMGRRALDSYLKYGYIPLEDGVPMAYHKNEQVSRTLEYAYDDFVLAQVAKALGHESDYDSLMIRANNYRNVFNPATGWVQGRHADGSFLSDDNTFSFCKFITEGTPGHYSWYVPHDVEGLIECMGGADIFESRLDSLFLKRQYWHGNEPCHQIAYLYNYINRPEKTQYHVHNILNTEYLDSPGGLSGNDDAGQMSAWYIFSALGFYPVCPGIPEYAIASPSFPEASIHLENGNVFTIRAVNLSDSNIYVQSMKLNGKSLDCPFISHQDIMKGGLLECIMSDVPNTK
ncbi:MAG: GH92 family glycosyl hydrolase [Bacteroidales bacterium]|nr:GH92 family glycosyl hydrolase [Bacteroidales bacterium]